MAMHVVGLVIDSTAVTMVRLSGSAKTYDMTLAVHQTLPQHPEPDEALAWQRQTLQNMVDTYHVRGEPLYVALPAQHAVLRNLTFPFKDPRRIRQTIKFALEDAHMPFEPEEVVVDFHILPAVKANETRLVVAGMPQEIVASSLALLQSLGLEPVSLDLDVFGLANATLCGVKALPAHTVALDVSPTHTLVTVMQQGTPVFVRSLAHSVCGDDATVVVQANRLSKHLQHTLYACENMLKQTYEPELLLVSGSMELQLGLVSTVLQEQMHCPATIWNLTADGYKPATSRLAPTELPRYAVAFGTAMRGLRRQTKGLNFRQEQFALYRGMEELRGRFISLGILLLLVCGLGFASLYLNNSYKTQRYAQLQNEMARIFRATFPDVRMVQPAVQMREKIRELDDRLKAFGGLTGAQLSGLPLLHEISVHIPAEIVVNVDNLTIATDTIDINGSTTSYDDVVKLKEAVEKSQFLKNVKIQNTKQDTDGKVSFKLTITTSKTDSTS